MRPAQPSVFNIYRLVKHSTDIMSLLFIIARVPTYIFPLGWNLMLLLNIQFDTAYGTVMAQMSAIPIMGMDFSNYFPIVIIVLTILLPVISIELFGQQWVRTSHLI